MLSDQATKFPDSIILTDKPLDFTSADIVRIFRKTFHIDKIGHAGTLDPKATGLLILCTGKLTKKISEFMDTEKEYEGIIRIGATTKSFDTETEEENIRNVTGITEEQVMTASKKFLGNISQIPPMYSAVKHKGKPLYKMARKGKEIERAPRSVSISVFEAGILSPEEISFRIVCSKGTYIRALANDFGAELGTGGYLKSLRRTRIGSFSVGNFEEKVRDISYRIINPGLQTNAQ